MSNCACHTEYGLDGTKTYFCAMHKLTPEKTEIEKLKAERDDLKDQVRELEEWKSIARLVMMMSEQQEVDRTFNQWKQTKEKEA